MNDTRLFRRLHHGRPFRWLLGYWEKKKKPENRTQFDLVETVSMIDIRLFRRLQHGRPFR